MTKAKILVVEDEWIIANAIQISLQKLGYDVPAVVSSGEEAIKKTDELEPNLILMDIVLQGDMDGIEVAEHIRAKYNIPVVYLTAYADEEILERAKITEPFGYIIKPFKDRELYSGIELALYNHKMDNKLKERELWLSTVLNTISDGVIITNAKGYVIFMNPVANYLTGWKEEEARGELIQNVFYTVNEKSREENKGPKKIVIDKGIVAGLILQATLIDKEGTKRAIEKSAAQMKDNKGKITGVVIIFRELNND